MATTTPNYGWDVPTSTDYVKDGATAIETLGDDIDATLYTALGGAYPGLRLVKKQTVGTGVASVTVTGAFSATYENYKIILTGGVGSGNAAMVMTLGATATGYYSGGVALQYGTTAVFGIQQANAANWSSIGRNSTGGNMINLDLYRPFESAQTGFTASANDFITGGFYVTNSGYLANTTSYTAFTIAPGTGTITGGTIYVYGYGAS